MNAFIKDIDYYLPARRLTNEEMVRDFPDWSVEKIADKIGVLERRVAAPDETATDLALAAAEKLFANGSVCKKDIDFVLFCTQSPDYKLPSSACIIQDRLGLSTCCGAFDFNLGCSGFEYGLAVAKGLIASRIASNILLLTGETYTKYLHPQDKGNRTIFGDAGTATVISTDGFAEIGEFVLGTDGAGYDSLIVRSGGARHPQPLCDIKYSENGNPHSPDHLFMDGQNIFAFTLAKVPKLVTDVLLKNQLQYDEINLFVFHQANKYMLECLRQKMKIQRNRFYLNIQKVGNTVSSTIPIALCEAKKQGQLFGNIVLAGFGVGLSWGATVIHI